MAGKIYGFIIIILLMTAEISFAKNTCDTPRVASIEVEEHLEDTVYLNISICAKPNGNYLALPRLNKENLKFKTDISGLELNGEKKLVDYPVLRPAEIEDAFTTDSVVVDIINIDTKERVSLSHPLELNWVAINDIDDPSYFFLEHLHEYIVYLIDYNSSKSYKKAKRLIDYSLSKKSDFVDVYHELARYLMKTKGFGTNSPGVLQAEQVLLTAKDINPNHANTRVLLGYVYSWQDRFDEAADEFEKAEKIGTDNLWLYTNWGQMYERKSEPKKAIKYYKIAIGGPKPRGTYARGMLFSYRYLSTLLVNEKMYEEASKINGQASEKFREKECFKAEKYLIDALYLKHYKSVLKQIESTKPKYCKNIYREINSIANIRLWNLKAKENQADAERYYRKSTITNPDYVSLVTNIAQYEFAESEGVLGNLKLNKRGLDVIDSESLSALMYTVLQNKPDAMLRLLKAGADVNKTYTEQAITALMVATAYNNSEAVKLLIRKGAKVTYESSSGISAIDIARNNGLTEILEILNNNKST